MLSFAWPWAFIALPLPFLVRWLMSEANTVQEAGLRVLGFGGFSMLRDRAEAETGERYRTALSGRPVRFHSADAARNAQAEVDLRDAYLTAGYDDVAFMFEPEAAALAAGPLAKGEYGLVVDIGGGTSDFSVFSRDSDHTTIIASQGMRIGGTDFATTKPPRRSAARPGTDDWNRCVIQRVAVE